MPSTIWSGKPRGPYPWNQRTNKQKDEDFLLARFQTEAERAEAARERYFKSVSMREKFFRLTRRRKSYDDYHRKLHAKRLKEEYAAAIHQALRTSWQNMADTDALTYQYPVEKAATKVSKENREEWLDTQKELDKWDLKHEQVDETVGFPREKGKVGKDKRAPHGPLPKPKDAKGGKFSKKPIEKLEVDRTKLPDPLLWGKEALAFMEVVKAKKTSELQQKFEANQLERKEKLEIEEAQRALEKELDEKRLQEIDWEREHGREALRIQEEKRVKDEEERLKFEYRQKMAMALIEERQVEWDAASSLDHELLSMMREDCLDEVYKEWLVWEEVRKKREEERKARRLQLCVEIILQMVTMADIRIDYKAEFNSEISATTWRGWKNLFIQGVILPCPIFGELVSTKPIAADPNSVVAKAAVEEYLDEQGEWQGADKIGKNKELGIILAEIHAVADAPPQPPKLPNLSQFKLKIAIIGTPFAGKTIIAKKLERDFGCVRIEMQNVIGSAVALAEAEEKVHKAVLAEEERMREMAEAQKILEEKQRIEFDLQQEALGLKDIYLRSTARIAVIESLSPHAESGKDLPSDQKAEKVNDSNPNFDIEKDSDQRAASKGKKSKGYSKDPKGIKSKDGKKTRGDGAKEILEKGKKGEEEFIEAPSHPVHEEQPLAPPPEPPHPLAYLTPKARFGMDIKLTQLEGLQAPPRALAGLLLLTLSNLQDYGMVGSLSSGHIILEIGQEFQVVLLLNVFSLLSAPIACVLDPATLYPTEDGIPQKSNIKKGVKGVPLSKQGTEGAGKKGKSPPVSPRVNSGGKPDSTAKKGDNSAKGKKDAANLLETEDNALGFILDGFPSNAEEAKALEWSLSGIDLDYIYCHNSKSSRVAPPPESVLRLRSRLDGYFQLQGLDENESFKRALGKVIDEKTGKIYHVDYDPPPTVKANPKEKGLVQRLKPVEELDTVRPKIISGLEAWPPLCHFLQNLINVFPIAQQEQESKKMVDTLEPSNLTAKFFDGWSKVQAVKAAAQAGLEAESMASKALSDAIGASKLADEVANKLWCAKLAEVETQNGLDTLGGDILAKQLIKDKASVTVTKRLDEACKAAKEAEDAAEAARMASLQAEQKANFAKEKVGEGDLEFAVHVKAHAEEAAEIAMQASIRAEEAHKKAVLAFEAATAALLPKPELTTEDKMEGDKKDKKDSKDSKRAREKEVAKESKSSMDTKDSKGSKSSKVSKGGKDGKDTKIKQGTKDDKIPASSPEPGSEAPLSPTSVTPTTREQMPSIEKELAVALHTEWVNVEATYLKQLKIVFYSLHQEKAITQNHVVQTIDQFLVFLQSSDERQSTFDNFQEKWNRIETAQRLDKSFKPRLQAEVANLDKSLKDICARREKRCVELSEKSLIDLLESRTTSLIKVITGLVQTELDRHLQSCSILKEFLDKAVGSELLAFRCALDEAVSVPAEKFPVPGWIVTLAAPLPKLYLAFMKAVSVGYVILDVISGKATAQVEGKGKKRVDKTHEKRDKTEVERKGKKDSVKKIPAATPILESTTPPPLDPSIPASTAREHEIFLHRLQRIAKVAMSYFEELQPIADGAFKRMKEWSQPKLKDSKIYGDKVGRSLAESAVVEEILTLCKEAAEEQIPLWYRVYLDGDVLNVDQSQLVLVQSSTHIYAKGRNVLQGDDKSEFVVLQNPRKLSYRLQGCFFSSSCLAAANYLPAGLVRETVNGAILKTHTLFKDDLKESLLPRMPASRQSPYGPFQSWGELSDRVFQEIIADPTKEAKFVDWRGLLTSLVDTQFSLIISSASCEDILAARKALFPLATLDKEGVLKGPDSHGYLMLDDLLAVKFWFDSSATPTPGEYDVGLALKIFLYNLLEEGSKGVHYEKLLLYMCRDQDRERALQKAFNAVAESGLLSADHQLKPEKLLEIVYPGGISAAWDQAIVPFILDDLYNLLYYVAKEKWDKDERDKESDFAGSEESGSNDDEDFPWLERMKVEAAESSSTSSDRATVEDFLAFAHKEFPELSQAETVHDLLCDLDHQTKSATKGDHRLDDDDAAFPDHCDVHVTVPTVQEPEVEEADPYAIPEAYTVKAILETVATQSLSNMLFGNYGSTALLLLDRITIEDDNPPPEPQFREEEQKVKKKRTKDKEKKSKKEKNENQ